MRVHHEWIAALLFHPGPQVSSRRRLGAHKRCFWSQDRVRFFTVLRV